MIDDNLRTHAEGHRTLSTTYLSETEFAPRLKPEVPDVIVLSSCSPSSSIVLVFFFRPSRMVARSSELRRCPPVVTYNLAHSVQQRAQPGRLLQSSVPLLLASPRRLLFSQSKFNQGFILPLLRKYVFVLVLRQSII